MFKKAIWSLIFCAHLTPCHLYAEPLIRVGAILPLSGPAANAGNTCRKGIEMHLNELGKTARIAVFFEDDQMVPKNTVLAYRKLKDVNNINLAFSVSANPGNALLPLTEQDGVVMISASSDNRLFTRQHSATIW